MMKHLFVLLALTFLPLWSAETVKPLESHERFFAPGEVFPGHVQGIAADESGICWSNYDRIFKTGWDGKLLAKVMVPRHAGDCTVKEGKLYVSITFYDPKDRLAAGGLTGAVYVYDCRDLKFLKRILLPECPRPDGITWYKDKLYIADDGGKQPHAANPVCIYDRNLKFVRKVMVNIGCDTRYGVQTLNVFQGKFLAGFYACKPGFSSVFLDPETLKVTGKFGRGTNVGFAAVPESVSGVPGTFCLSLLCGKAGAWRNKGKFYCMDSKGNINCYSLTKIKVNQK